MAQKTLADRLFYNACCFVLYFLAAAVSFNGYYDKWHFGEDGVSGEDDRFQFEMVMDGTAFRPYVFRQMLPSAANWIDHAVPQSFRTWLYSYQAAGPGARIEPIFDSPTAENPVYFFRYLIVYGVTFLFALLAVYALHLVCLALDLPPPAAVIAPVIVILLFPYIESGGGYFYDYPELAFLALAVWASLKFRWWWVIPVVALGTWNKESFLFFIPALYPFFRRRGSRLDAFLAVAVLSLVSVAVYYPIRLHFAHNPGAALESHWRDQLQYFLHWDYFLLGTEKTYGLPMLKAFTLVPLALLAWNVARAWPRLPRIVQRHAQIAAAINLPLYFLFCWPGELRDLSMLYVVFLLVLAINLNNWFGSFARSE
jgi:hypothetical protein